jgi:hypothetical protein
VEKEAEEEEEEYLIAVMIYAHKICIARVTLSSFSNGAKMSDVSRNKF